MLDHDRVDPVEHLSGRNPGCPIEAVNRLSSARIHSTRDMVSRLGLAAYLVLAAEQRSRIEIGMRHDEVDRALESPIDARRIHQQPRAFAGESSGRHLTHMFESGGDGDH